MSIKIYYYTNRSDNMPTGLRERKKLRTRLLIIDEGRRLFEKKGFEHTSIDDICDLVDISKATFYNYFPSKDSLFISMYEQDIDEILEVLEYGDTSPIKQLKNVYETMLRISKGYKYMVGMSYLLMSQKGEFEGTYNKFRSAILNVLQSANTNPSFSNEEIFTILNGLYYSVVMNNSEEQYEEAFFTLFDKIITN